MKKASTFILLLICISCQSGEQELKLQRSLSIKWGDNQISDNDHFHLSADSAQSSMTIFYSHENNDKQWLCTMDNTEMLYGATLYIFASGTDDGYVVVWKTEHEYSPTFQAYYIHDGALMNIGAWGIYTPSNESQDTLDYSIDDIRITRQGETIRLVFLKDAKFVDYSESSSDDNWKFYKASGVTLSFNTHTGTLSKSW